jgi:hypothetical protein
MRLLRTGLVPATCFSLLGFAAPAGQMPPNTIALSYMMKELSARPGFTEAFLREVEGGAKKSGATLLTPALVDHLRSMILGNDWQGLDHFPGWTMREINPTVRVIGHIAGKNQKVESSATAGGAPGAGIAHPGSLAAFVDLGTYALDKPATESLDTPSNGKRFDQKEFITTLSEGVTRGDGPNSLAPMHADSTRLAEVMNRLSLNGFDGVAPFEAQVAGKTVSTAQDLIAALLASGHTVEVSDSRYFANFGHLHYKGQDVMMPFYVNSHYAVPGTDRPLLVPVSHAEYEWQIRGPRVNAAVSFYFGIDGKAEFRTMDQLDQTWVMNRHAHEYRGSDAIEVTRLNAAMVPAYARLHAAHPTIPFGGYYAFGVCQDEVAAIELKMTGKATLFPNTADERFFTDPRDAEINALIARLPKDRDGRLPEIERIFGSLPAGSSKAELATISIPGLAEDLLAVHDAWTAGKLRRWHSRTFYTVRLALLAAGVLLALITLGWIRKRPRT